jgi:hypothetical protein
MSRAFVNEDHEPPRKRLSFDLPDPDDPGFDAAVARALLEAARVSEVADAEETTGVKWGEPRLAPHVEGILAEAIAAGDDRLEQVAERYLRVAREGN